MTDEERWSWRDQPGVTWAAGAAAVGLIALLVFAVFRTSTSSQLPGDFSPATSSDTAESSLVTATASTSYALPSVLTSEGAGPEVSAPPTVAPPTVAPPPEDTVTSTTTTTPNPYVTTTTQNGGAV